MTPNQANNELVSTVQPAWLTTPAVRDRRWLEASVWVGCLIAAGTLFSFLTARPLWEYSTSARASFVYLPVATVVILGLGWTRFPLAAAIFYGYLALAQPTGYSFYLAGSHEGALTVEMVLAVPLLITGLIGSGAPRYRPLPLALKLGWGLLLLAGVIATLLAEDVRATYPTLFGRFLVPMAVTLVVYRRLRTVADYRVVWYGLAVGMVAVLAFGFRRAILGIDTYDVAQRAVGLKGTSSIPALYVVGGALWLAVVRTETNRFFQGALWLGIVALVGVLIWLAAGRAPLLGFALLLAWWFFRRGVRTVYRPKLLILWILGGGLAAAAVAYSLERTLLDLRLMLDRIEQMLSHGVTGESRWVIWSTALEHWKSSPIWGLGPNSWITLNTGFASVHSSMLGILIDTGLVGVAAFLLLFGGTLRAGRAKLYQGLGAEDREFVLGCRAGWIAVNVVLAVFLPFTSGQAYNNIFAYIVLLYPMLTMIAYTSSPRLTPQAAVPWPARSKPGLAPAAAPLG